MLRTVVLERIVVNPARQRKVDLIMTIEELTPFDGTRQRGNPVSVPEFCSDSRWDLGNCTPRLAVGLSGDFR